MRLKDLISEILSPQGGWFKIIGVTRSIKPGFMDREIMDSVNDIRAFSLNNQDNPRSLIVQVDNKIRVFPFYTKITNTLPHDL